MQLFRQQAIDHQHRLYGEVLLVQPLRWRVIGLLVFGLIVTAALFLVLGTYGRTVMTKGIVRPAGDVELHVPSSVVSQISPGQNVLITFSVSSMPGPGSLHGVIERVDHGPIDDTRPYIPLRVRLDPPTTGQSPGTVALRPGTMINGHIVLARRSLLQGVVEQAGGAPAR